MFYITQNVAFYLLYCFKRRRDNGTTVRAGYDEYMTCARARRKCPFMCARARAPLGTFFILGETLLSMASSIHGFFQATLMKLEKQKHIAL